MSLDNPQEQVIRIISEQLGITESEVKPEKKLTDDLGCDSLDTVELVMALEDEFGIEIPDDDIESIKTVQQVQDYIALRLGADRSN